MIISLRISPMRNKKISNQKALNKKPTKTIFDIQEGRFTLFGEDDFVFV